MIISSYLEDYEYALQIGKQGISFKRALGVYPGDVDDLDEELFEKYAVRMKETDCG